MHDTFGGAQQCAQLPDCFVGTLGIQSPTALEFFSGAGFED